MAKQPQPAAARPAPDNKPSVEQREKQTKEILETLVILQRRIVTLAAQFERTKLKSELRPQPTPTPCPPKFMTEPVPPPASGVWSGLPNWVNNIANPTPQNPTDPRETEPGHQRSEAIAREDARLRNEVLPTSPKIPFDPSTSRPDLKTPPMPLRQCVTVVPPLDPVHVDFWQHFPLWDVQLRLNELNSLVSLIERSADSSALVRGWDLNKLSNDLRHSYASAELDANNKWKVADLIARDAGVKEAFGKFMTLFSARLATIKSFQKQEEPAPDPLQELIKLPSAPASVEPEAGGSIRA